MRESIRQDARALLAVTLDSASRAPIQVERGTDTEVEPAPDLYETVLDSLMQHICVIDDRGVILWVNAAWERFSMTNGGDRMSNGPGAPYLGVCNGSATSGDPDAVAVCDGLTKIMSGASTDFEYEYPCHSPHEERWFTMRITRLASRGSEQFVISHHNITERKLAEQRIEDLAMLDGLTGIANRRHLDEFIDAELRHARTRHQPVSMLLIDLDLFKQFNDDFGHLAGDETLKAVATTIQQFGGRPREIVARYGGEEFAVVLGNADSARAEVIAEQIRIAVSDLRIPHPRGAAQGVVTVSTGVATARPGDDMTDLDLIEAADVALYAAKSAGRDRVVVGDPAGSTLSEHADH